MQVKQFEFVGAASLPTAALFSFSSLISVKCSHDDKPELLLGVCLYPRAIAIQASKSSD